MIMISSTAGVRLATLKWEMNQRGAEFQEAFDTIPMSEDAPDLHIKYLESRQRFIEAAEALADELIADNHHLREGD